MAARQVDQKKQPGNPKTQLAIRRITRGQHLDKLIVAGGCCKGGGGLLAAIKTDLLNGLPHSKRSGREAKHSGCFKHKRDVLRYNKNAWVRAASGFHHEYFDEIQLVAELFGDPDFVETDAERLQRTKSMKRLREDLFALEA